MIYLFSYLFIYLFNFAKQNYTNDMHIQYKYNIIQVTNAGIPQQLKPITVDPFNK